MSIKTKIKNGIHSLFMMSKEEKIKPIMVPTDKDKMLDGKIALITGGTSGIGLAIAKAFINSGAKVIIVGTNKDKMTNALNKLELVGGGQSKGLIIDVRDVDCLSSKVKEAASLFDEDRIDILVNSAGLVTKHDFFNTDEDEYDGIMDTNAKGVFFMSQAVSKLMIEKKIKGHILNVTSSSALRPAWTPYQMSKWAIKGFTLGL